MRMVVVKYPLPLLRNGLPGPSHARRVMISWVGYVCLKDSSAVILLL